MISPARLFRLGLSVEEVAAWLGLTIEDVEAGLEAAETMLRDSQQVAPTGHTLMTTLLFRPDMERWEMRRAER